MSRLNPRAANGELLLGAADLASPRRIVYAYPRIVDCGTATHVWPVPPCCAACSALPHHPQRLFLPLPPMVGDGRPWLVAAGCGEPAVIWPGVVEEAAQMEHQRTPLAELIVACREETARYLRREPSREVFCWEIARRAVCERDDPAWQALIDQYRGLVLMWVRRRPVAFQLEDDGDFWVFRAFARFWRSVGPERFERFEGLAQLLGYLEDCALTAIVDEVRARGSVHLGSLTDHEYLADHRARVDPAVLDRLIVDQLWRLVQDAAHSEAERLVVQLRFALRFTPAEIQARHPAVFPARNDVYRTIRNLKERLERQPEIQRLLEAIDDADPTPA